MPLSWQLKSFTHRPATLLYFTLLHSTELPKVQVRIRVTLRLAVYRQSLLLGDKPLEAHDENFIFQLNTCVLFDERMGLSFTIVAGTRQRSHSQVRVPRDSWPRFTVSDSKFPQSGGLGLRIYIPPDQDVPVIPPGTGFPFHRLLRLAGLRWRYSTPLPHGLLLCFVQLASLYNLGTESIEYTSPWFLCCVSIFQQFLHCCPRTSCAWTCLQSRCLILADSIVCCSLAMDISSRLTIFLLSAIMSQYGGTLIQQFKQLT
jgi:hypothetical protein